MDQYYDSLYHAVENVTTNNAGKPLHIQHCYFLMHLSGQES